MNINGTPESGVQFLAAGMVSQSKLVGDAEEWVLPELPPWLVEWCIEWSRILNELPAILVESMLLQDPIETVCYLEGASLYVSPTSKLLRLVVQYILDSGALIIVPHNRLNNFLQASMLDVAGVRVRPWSKVFEPIGRITILRVVEIDHTRLDALRPLLSRMTRR